MSFPEDALVKKILKPFVEDELVKGHTLDPKKSTLIVKIDTIVQEYKVTIVIAKDYPNGEYQISYEGKKMTSSKPFSEMLLSVIEIFTKIRDSFIEESNLEETPVTAKETYEDMFEEEHILTKHSYETNLFFGKASTSVIKELDQVRFCISPDLLPSDMSKLYEITKGNAAIFGLQFAPDYTGNSKAPSLQFKKESIQGYNPGFTEHIVNITRRYLVERWAQILKGQKIPIYECGLNINAEKKAKLAHVKGLYDKKQVAIANATALYYCNFNRDDAAMMIMDAGGILEDTIISDGKINFVLEIVAFLYLCMPHLCESCLVCGETISIEKRTVPTICTGFKCQFEYIEMHVCQSIHVSICPSSVYRDLTENENVVDLLIGMTYAAAVSNRRNKIFEPFPPHFDINGTRNYDGVCKVLNNFPSVKDMLKNSNNEKSLCKYLGSDEYEMLTWILSNSRVAMLKMPEKKRISEMNTEHQYMMLVDNPERSAEFAKARAKHGSYFAFHGSSPENWHSILRRGLINASNTDLMTTGAAYGSGVYMAEDSSTSFGYARQGSGWKKSIFGDTSGLQCMAICEVVKLPGVPTTPNPYYVVENVNAITPRFFLFYPRGGNVNVQAKNLHDQLTKLI
jgi:hypothetical protein